MNLLQHPLINIFFLDFLMMVLRGTRQLGRKEGRSISGTLRRRFPQIFETEHDIGMNL